MSGSKCLPSQLKLDLEKITLWLAIIVSVTPINFVNGHSVHQGRGREVILQDFRGSGTSNEPRLLRMGVSIVERNVWVIHFVIFRNPSHIRWGGGMMKG